MQNAGAVLAALCERGRKTLSRSRHKSLESPVHRKVPAGFGGRLRGKGPQQRDLAAQPILLLDIIAQDDVEVAWSGDQDVVEAFSTQGADEALGDRVRPW